MKTVYKCQTAIVFTALFLIQSLCSYPQAIAPEKSANAAAVSDTRFIASGIGDNQAVLMLSTKASVRAADGRIKELAAQMSDDQTALLYSLQELASAGGNFKAADTLSDRQQMAEDLNKRLSGLSGSDFDTVWVTGVLSIQQARYEEMVKAKETVMNPQLKSAITEAIPVVRKQCSQLRIIQKNYVRIAAQNKKAAAKKINK